MTGVREPRRLRLTCTGAVQGVGFRPAVHRLAQSLSLAGWVRNGPEGVVVEVEGTAPQVDEFVRELPRSLPPLANLAALRVEPVEAAGEQGFRVLESQEGVRRGALTPPDAALCAACRRDMETSGDRRFRYPFTTCTDCGPRFSLVHALPYDRKRTAMACFPLCAACREEYEDPSDRRFHAEPLCCPHCGPALVLRRGDGSVAAEGDEAVAAARLALAEGRIVAVKGLGGFQLACRADREDVVEELRRRKARPAKPFAVMAPDGTSAAGWVDLSAAATALLESPHSPVVLAPRRAGSPVAASVAPGLADLGVMLPTTPLHVELFREAEYPALVMTSGNRSDEPICRTNREVLQSLAGIADLFLLHDRDVVRRVDDSVVRDDVHRPFLVRRSRGWVPAPLPLPEEAAEPVLALGPFLQNTACLAVGREGFLSQHVGDLDTEGARAFLAEVVAGLEEFLQVRAPLLVVDAHPDYPSTWLGEELARLRGGRLLRVQHHIAHGAAVLAEHGAFPAAGEQALTLALDGTGWGGDGAAWGGEWLLLRGDLSWRRLARLQPLPLVGGEAAVREPWRVLAAALAAAGEQELLQQLPWAGRLPEGRLQQVVELAGQGTFPVASGAGRLFEAAGALLAGVLVNGYEGEAAARLEALAGGSPWAALAWPEVVVDPEAAFPELPSAQLLAAAGRRLLGGEAPGSVARGFHATFSRLVAAITCAVAPPGLGLVAAGGGCLVNRLLRRDLREDLGRAGWELLAPVAVPPGDGGLAYGQAVLGTVAGARSVAIRMEEGGFDVPGVSHADFTAN